MQSTDDELLHTRPCIESQYYIIPVLCTIRPCGVQRRWKAPTDRAAAFVRQRSGSATRSRHRRSDQPADPSDTRFFLPSFLSSTFCTAPTTTMPPLAEAPVTAPSGYLYNSFPVYHNADGRPPEKPTRVLAPDLLRGLLMVIMAFDHVSVMLRTWEHGTGRVSEADGQVVREWNFRTAYVIRSLTHLCGAGFTFLLGMGVVYLGRSRSRLGWSAGRLARYFALRGVALTIVTVVMGFVMTLGQLWFMNAILFALAVDYVLAGLLWLAVNKTEALLARAFAQVVKRWDDRPQSDTDTDDEDRTPLLREAPVVDSPANWSWTIHNYLLLGLSLVTIWWNIWLAENGGRCDAQSASASAAATPIAYSFGAGSRSTPSVSNPVLRIWFWLIMLPEGHIMSNFPPMAWLSFAIMGIVYGRILLARPWSRPALVLGHSAAAVAFLLLFVLTRVLQFGNLSVDCLQTPDQLRHPHRNQYLASAASFFYIVKYTPDVAYMALTMGGNMALLAAFTAIPPRVGKRLTLLLDLGTSALFFYVVHMGVLMVASIPLLALFGEDTGVENPMRPGDTFAITSLWVYFAVWVGVVMILWPLCRWYSRFKSTKSADSLWRFF